MDFLHVLAELRTPFGEHFFQFVTYLGQEVIIIAVICTLYWCVDKRFALSAGIYLLSCRSVCTGIKDHIPDPTALDIRSKLFSSGKRRTCCDRLLLSKRTYPGWYLPVRSIHVQKQTLAF